MKEEKFWILVSKKVTGEADAEELKLLQELIDSNPGWNTITENLEELWNSRPLEHFADKDLKNEDAYLIHLNRLKEKVSDFSEYNSIIAGIEGSIYPVPSKKTLYKNWITYASVAAVITAIIFLYPGLNSVNQVKGNPQPKPVNEIAITPGSKTKIQLPDGSEVWVNSGSKLTYEGRFDGSTRDVHLDGEAYFEVVKDAAHPFIVHTSDIDINVLGTAFNVKAYKTEPTIEATLIHGSIEVINKSQPGSTKIMLKPHEKLVYNKYVFKDIKNQMADIKPVVDSFSIIIKPLRKNIADNDIVETAWVYNKLIFEDERFADLALKMERWYNVKISIEYEKMKNYRISGSFVNETAEEALKALQLLVPFSYSIKNNEVKIIKK